MAVQWSWQAPPELPQALVSPLVANLTDDNADGTIDLCDTPDVVVVAGSGDTGEGRVFVLDGATGAEEREFFEAVDPTTTPAIADLDDDGMPEIIACSLFGSLIAYEPDGNIKWVSREAMSTHYASSLVVTDLRGDGGHEILAGGQVFDRDGTLLWSHPESAVWGMSPVAADLDGDGVQEVVLGPTAYRADGSLYYDTPELATVFGSQFTQVADLGDGRPSTALVSSAGIALLDAAGAVEHVLQADPDHTLAGGPIAIADLRGDGDRELIVPSSEVKWTSGGERVTELEAFASDGTLLWSVPTQDESCCAGAVAFDLDGDGRDEVIYNDQLHFYVIDGTGHVLATADRVSQTTTETPIVADVDNDGAAEILVVSSAPDPAVSTEQVPTLRVFRDTDDAWAPTRRVWNQHAYVPSNITEDARVVPHAPLPDKVRVNTSSPACATTQSVIQCSHVPAMPNVQPSV